MRKNGTLIISSCPFVRPFVCLSQPFYSDTICTIKIKLRRQLSVFYEPIYNNVREIMKNEALAAFKSAATQPTE